MRTQTNIPVTLCEYVLKNRKITPFKLYLHLKLISDGYVVYNNESIKEWSEIIGVNVKTARACFHFLIKHKWITINSKRNVVHIISYRRLANKLNIDLQSGYLYELEDFRNLKALCCAIVITRYLCRKRFFDKRQSECKFGRSNTNCRRKKDFYPMSNSYFARCVGVSRSTACRYKQLAEQYGYIDTKDNYSFMSDGKGENIRRESFYIVQKGWFDEGRPNNVRKGRQYVLVIKADLIHSNILHKKKSYHVDGKN